MADLALQNRSGALTIDGFHDATYIIKRPFWSLLGRTFRVFNPEGALVMFVKHPVFKMREEFTLFADESETQALAQVKARSVIAINMAYDVFDPTSGQRLGTLKRRGFKSMLRDTWDILGPDTEQPVGLVEETGAALLRRFLPILTGKWKIEYEGQEVGRIRQIFRFFVKEYALELHAEQSKIDPRFAVACALLALMAETRREQSS